MSSNGAGPEATFDLEFSIYSALLEQASPSGNPFDSHNQLIVRLDQLSRNEELQEKLCAAGWEGHSRTTVSLRESLGEAAAKGLEMPLATSIAGHSRV